MSSGCAISAAKSSDAGHLGTNVIRRLDAIGLYTIIIRFDCYDHLKAWVESDACRNHVRNVEPILVGGDRIEIKSGLDFWFTPPGVRASNRFKQFLITFSAIYPLTRVIPAGGSPAIEAMPPPGNLFISRFLIACIIVWLLVYVIMPRYTRAVADWLYR